MYYLDFSPTEIDRLYEFHRKHPDKAVRVYNDEADNDNPHKYHKRAVIFYGEKADIVDTYID